MRKVIGATILFLALALFTVSSSFAEDSTPSSRFEQLKTSIQNKLEVRKTERLAKLDAAKLKVCQVKEKVITNRQNRLNKLTDNIFTKFDKITTRVEDFYNTKLVPEGKTVSNYDDLVANIQTKKTAAQDALNAAKRDSTSFTCTSDNPKAVIKTFRTDMQAVKKTLKDYRSAIRDLIVAVKSVVGEEKSQ